MDEFLGEFLGFIFTDIRFILLYIIILGVIIFLVVKSRKTKVNKIQKKQKDQSSQAFQAEPNKPVAVQPGYYKYDYGYFNSDSLPSGDGSIEFESLIVEKINKDFIRDIRSLLNLGFIPYKYEYKKESHSVDNKRYIVRQETCSDGNGGTKYGDITIEKDIESYSYSYGSILFFRIGQNKSLHKEYNELKNEIAKIEKEYNEYKKRSKDAAEQFAREKKPIHNSYKQRLRALEGFMSSVEETGKLLALSDEELVKYVTNGLSYNKYNDDAVREASNQVYKANSAQGILFVTFIPVAIVVFIVSLILLFNEVFQNPFQPFINVGITFLIFLGLFIGSVMTSSVSGASMEHDNNYGMIPDRRRVFSQTANALLKAYSGENILKLNEDLCKWLKASGYMR